MTLNDTICNIIQQYTRLYNTLYKAIRHHTTLYNVKQDYTTIYKAIRHVMFNKRVGVFYHNIKHDA